VNKHVFSWYNDNNDKEQGIRNQVEGKFGQGKNAYNLNFAALMQQENLKAGLHVLCL